MMMLIAILLYFFTICCEYAFLTEIDIGNGSSNRGQKRGRDSNEVLSHPNSMPKIDLEANSELAKIFELHDLLAVRGQKLFAHPEILDDLVEPLKSTDIIDEMHFHERMSNLLRDILEIVPIQAHREKAKRKEIELTPEQRKRFIKYKYPNPHRLLFQPLLMDAINKVDIQNEIQNDLKTIWAEENADELRIKQKYLFQFGFIMDCIYAYYMDGKQKIDFDKIATKTIMKVSKVEQHPFYYILAENKCASEDEIRIFMNLIISQNTENIDESLQDFFISRIKDQFVNEMTANEEKMKGKLEEKYAQLRKDPYFPEKLPKLSNLLALLEVTSEIIVQIIKQIKPKDYDNQMKLMDTIKSILKINVSEGGKVYISSHYKRLANKIPNEKLRTNLRAISIKDTVFTSLFNNDIIYSYGKWYNHLKVHMIKFLAVKYYGISDLENNDDWEMIGFKIGKSIVQKTLSHIQERNTRKKEEKKNELLAQLHLRIFCLGIRQMDSTKRILSSERFSEKSIFHSYMVSELLEFVPGAMKKFNEIVFPKEEIFDMKQEMNLFFVALSEVRHKMC